VSTKPTDAQSTTPLPQVTIYSDGGADPNPGPGGWGAVLIFIKSDGSEVVKELSGGHEETTNNRMELTAAIESLRALKQACAVEFYTDSVYLKNGVTKWMEKWLATDFKKGKIENVDLWQQVNVEVSRHRINWHWVKGHAGNHYNERADQLATAAIPRAEIVQDPTAVKLYPRVSCIGNPGAGAWAVVIASPHGDERLLSGGRRKTTPNELDLLSAIAALNELPVGGSAHLYTGSSYLQTGITQWVPAWKRSNWIKKTGGEVKYRELWEQLDALAQARHINWILYKDDTRPAALDQLDQPLREIITQQRG